MNRYGGVEGCGEVGRWGGGGMWGDGEVERWRGGIPQSRDDHLATQRVSIHQKNIHYYLRSSNNII